MKYTWHRQDIIGSKCKHRHQYTEYKKCLGKMMHECIKGALSGLRQFLAVESPLKMMKNALYFTSKALFIMKIFELLS